MALIRKIIESTLIAGQTDITFTDADIPNSLLRVYATLDSLFPISQTITGNSIKITYEAQSSNVGIALEIVKEGLQVIDNLTSEDTDNALSANQGKQLKTLIDNIVIPTVPDNITDLNDVEVTDITNNQVLAWDAIDSKFKNVDQSGGSGGIDYSTTEQDTGIKWINGKPIYQRSFALSSDLICGSNSWTYTGMNATNVDFIIDHECLASNGTNWGAIEVNLDTINNVRQFGILNTRNANISVRYLTVRYTKTTDTANT